MVLAFCFKVDLVRFFWSAIVAKPFRFSVYGHTGTPLVLKPNNTHKAGFVSPVGFADVLRISVGEYVSKVRNSVVGLISVNMVNKTRPRSIKIKPYYTVLLIPFTKNANISIPTNCYSTSD